MYYESANLFSKSTFFKNKSGILSVSKNLDLDQQASRYMCVAENYFSYFSTKQYVVGTQKNPLNETVLLSTQNMFGLLGKKIIAFLGSSFLLNWTYGSGLSFCLFHILYVS